MKFHHILWDYDGTLFNTYPVMAASFHEALGEYGVAEPVEEIAARMRVTLTEAFRHYRQKHRLGEEAIDRYRAINRAAEAVGTAPFEGALTLCRAVIGAGGRNYLYTHRDQSAIFFLDKFGALADFAECVTSEHGFPHKPSPEAILHLVSKHGFQPDDALMVGDREIDILAAKNAGISGCFFSPERARCVIADANVSNFRELAEFLGIEM